MKSATDPGLKMQLRTPPQKKNEPVQLSLLMLYRRFMSPCIIWEFVTRLSYFVCTKTLPYSVEDINKITMQCGTCACEIPRFTKSFRKMIKAAQPFKRLNINFKGPLPMSAKKKNSTFSWPLMSSVGFPSNSQRYLFYDGN